MELDEDLSARKRPRQQRAQQTVDAIFEAMFQLLEKNATDSPIHTIAARAGVSVGSLYQYFPSKASLLSALIGFQQRRAVANIEQWLASAKGLTGEEAARQLVDSLIDTKKKRLKVELALLRYFCRVGDLSTLTAHDSQLIGAIQRFIEQLGPEVRPVNTRMAAFLITNALRSAVVMCALQQPEQLIDPEFKSELVRLVVSYLKR